MKRSLKGESDLSNLETIEKTVKSLLENLQMMEDTHDSLVIYESRIEQIEAGGPGKPAMVRLSGEKIPRTPSVVYVMEGYRSTTRSLLGIDVVKQSKAALLGYSFFEEHKNQALHQELLSKLSKVIDLIQAIPPGLKIVKQILSDANSIQGFQSLFNTLGRAEILLKIPGSDYFYFTPNSEDIDKIKSLKKDLVYVQKAKDKWWDALERYLKENAEHFSDTPHKEDYADLMHLLKKSHRTEWANDPIQTQKVFDKLHKIAENLSPVKAPNPNPIQAFLNELNAASEEASKAENEYEKFVEDTGKNISGPGRLYQGRSLSNLTDNLSS